MKEKIKFWLSSVCKKTPIYSLRLMKKVLRYACQKNAHLRKVNSAFSDFTSLELGVFSSDNEFSCKH